MASTTLPAISLLATLIIFGNLQTTAARRLLSIPGIPGIPEVHGIPGIPGLPATLPLPSLPPFPGLLTPSNGLPTLPLPPLTPSTGFPTLSLPPFTPPTGLPTLPLPPVNPTVPNFPFPIGTPSILPPAAGIFTPPVAGTVHP